jgi:lipid-A-disaccharide synthase
MKYHLVAGEASGDIHGSKLIEALKAADSKAEFRCWGGDAMAKASGNLVSHYKDRAYMGLWEVLTHLRKISAYLKQAQEDILSHRPDVLILIDNPGFNLRLAAFAKKHGIPVHYYIAPKVWAWNESRVKQIKKNVDRLYCILPFEEAYFAKHGIEAVYVGNPSKEQVDQYQSSATWAAELGITKPIIAVLPGSRISEIQRILPTFLEIPKQFPDYEFVVAAAPDFDVAWYQQFDGIGAVKIVKGQTHEVLSHAQAALVASGTATLETALFGVPQVVCYRVAGLTYRIGKLLVKLQWFGLVNLILNRALLTELLQADFTAEQTGIELEKILSEPGRGAVLQGYDELRNTLGNRPASETVAVEIVRTLQG